MRVRKKPVEVEAIQYTGHNYDEICKFAGEKLKKDPSRKLLIPTLEGTMKASIGDFIIKGVHGELYPCKPDPFYETYELLE
jgi:hypothetical protein